jgi:hypothetical protein
MPSENEYTLPELTPEELKALTSTECFDLVLTELRQIELIPTALRELPLITLSASPVAKKSGLSEAKIRKLVKAISDKKGCKARQAAIELAKQNGTMDESDALWIKNAKVVTYALPEGYLIQKESGHDGFSMTCITGSASSPLLVGPMIYPYQELEDGTFRFMGWDRW